MNENDELDYELGIIPRPPLQCAYKKSGMEPATYFYILQNELSQRNVTYYQSS